MGHINIDIRDKVVRDNSIKYKYDYKTLFKFGFSCFLNYFPNYGVYYEPPLKYLHPVSSDYAT